MQLLDGKSLSQQILNSLKLKIVDCRLKINLHVILVGNDPNSLKYVSLKEKRAQEIGVEFTLHHLPESTTEIELLSLVNSLNNDPKVTGFFTQLPMPLHINRNRVLYAIDPKKDVDGLNPKSSFTPAVVKATIRLLDYYHLAVADKTAVIINKSQLIGVPLQKILEKRGCTVFLADINTKNIPKLGRGADILISATGRKELVTADYIKPGAVVVDIGGGDVDFGAVKDVCSYITPTIGGIGPMTIACLLENLVNVAIK